jgi:hypothetical protein
MSDEVKPALRRYVLTRRAMRMLLILDRQLAAKVTKFQTENGLGTPQRAVKEMLLAFKGRHKTPAEYRQEEDHAL